MKNKTQTSDEVFVNLLLVAREDERIGKFLKAIVYLSDFERKSIINTLVAEMALKGAPSEFVQAIAALRDPDIVALLNQWLKSQENDDSPS